MQKKPFNITISGPQGAGKTTLANNIILATRNAFMSSDPLFVVRTAFADPLYRICSILTRENGPIDKAAEYKVGDRVFTGRTLLQYVGTDIGREHFGDSVWVNLWDQAFPEAKIKIADDCRFRNEQGIAALSIYLMCDEVPEQVDHKSETDQPYLKEYADICLHRKGNRYWICGAKIETDTNVDIFELIARKYTTWVQETKGGLVL